MQMKKLAFALPLIAVLAAIPIAFADSVSPIAFRIDASNGDGSGFAEIPLSDFTWNGTLNRYSWSPSMPLEIWGDNPTEPVATLPTATLIYQFGATKRIGITFNIDAGTTDTIISFRSGLMGFDTVSGALAKARATAAIGVSNFNGDGIGRIEEYPTGTGNGIYETFYDGDPGTRFVGLVSWADVGSGGGSASQNYPPGAGQYEPLGVGVDNIRTEFNFILTAGDRGSGNTQFIITPEPTTLALIPLGVLLVLRRRR